MVDRDTFVPAWSSFQEGPWLWSGGCCWLLGRFSWQVWGTPYASCHAHWGFEQCWTSCACWLCSGRLPQGHYTALNGLISLKFPSLWARTRRLRRSSLSSLFLAMVIKNWEWPEHVSCIYTVLERCNFLSLFNMWSTKRYLFQHLEITIGQRLPHSQEVKTVGTIKKK